MNSAEDSRIFRFLGSRPFSDCELHRRLFFGRDGEVCDLFNQILGTNLLVLYGKSGLGKTSLLQAAIFPRLREQDILPLPVRLNQPDVSPLEVFLAAIEKACREQGVDYTPGERTNLWEFFKTAVFWRNGELQTPLLVLDQFEEIFTLHSGESRSVIVRELGELLGMNLPAPIRARREAGERLPYSDKPPSVKIILSLRESSLGSLEELTTDLPKVLENRFRLVAMDQEMAERAIVGPASLEQGEVFATPPFGFSKEMLMELLDFLGGKTGTVEPFTLQVLCSHVESKVVLSRVRSKKKIVQDEKGITVTQGDLGGRAGMEALLGSFYRDCLLVLPRRQRKRARRLCADGLLSPDGRRLMMEESQALRTYKLRPKSLMQLVDAHLLRNEPRLDSYYYELSHDSLVQPVLRERPWRVPRGVRIGLGIVAVLLVFFFFTAIIAASFALLLDEEKNRAEQARTKAESLMAFMTFDLPNKLRPIGRVEILGDVNERVLEAYDDLKLESANSNKISILGAAYNTHGDLFVSKGRSGEALDFYKKSQKIYEYLVKLQPDEMIWQSNLALVFGSSGRVLMERGDLPAAKDMFEQEQAALEELGKRQHDYPDLRSRLAGNHENLGNLSMIFDNLAEAYQQYERQREILEGLAQEKKDDDALQHSLAWASINVGDVLQMQGHLAEAKGSFQTARAILQSLVERNADMVDWQRSLAASEERVGGVHLACFELVEARQAYETMAAIFRRLTEFEPANKDWQRCLLVAYHRIGSVDMAGYVQADSLKDYVDFRSLALVQNERAVVSPGRIIDPVFVKTLGQAQKTYKDSLLIAEKQTRLDPANILWKRDVGWNHLQVGYVLAAQQKVEEALDAYGRAADIAKTSVAAVPDDVDSQRFLVHINICTGRLHTRRGDFAAARAVYTKALAVAEQHVAREPNDKDWQTLLDVSNDGLGDLLLAEGNLTAAQQAYSAVLESRRQLAAAAPINASWQLDLAVSLYKVAMLEQVGLDVPVSPPARLQDARDIVERLKAEGRLPPVAAQWPDLFAGPSKN